MVLVPAKNLKILPTHHMTNCERAAGLLKSSQISLTAITGVDTTTWVKIQARLSCTRASWSFTPSAVQTMSITQISTPRQEAIHPFVRSLQTTRGRSQRLTCHSLSQSEGQRAGLPWPAQRPCKPATTCQLAWSIWHQGAPTSHSLGQAYLWRPFIFIIHPCCRY